MVTMVVSASLTKERQISPSVARASLRVSERPSSSDSSLPQHATGTGGISVSRVVSFLSHEVVKEWKREVG